MPLIVNTHIVPTTTYHIEGPNRLAPIFYMIPGNPGLCEFYETFMEELKILQPNFEYVCPSHIGFDTMTSSSYGLHSGNVSHTLNEQIDHKISFIRELIRDSSPNKNAIQPRDVVIMGHSVGAWMVQRIVVTLQNDPLVNIKFVGLLTPTVKDIAKSYRGGKLVAANKYVSDPGYYISRFSQVLNWTIPRGYLKSGLGYIMGSPPDVALNAALSLVTKPKIVKQAIDMGSEEMTRIGSELEPEDIRGFWSSGKGYKIWMFFVKDDHWISNETREELIKAFKNDKHVEAVVEAGESSIAHAFCVRDSNHVAQLVSNQISQIKFEFHSELDKSNKGPSGSGVTSSSISSDPIAIANNKAGLGKTEIVAVDVVGDSGKVTTVPSTSSSSIS